MNVILRSLSLVNASRLQKIFFLIMLASIQFAFVVDYLLLLPLGPEIMQSYSIKPGHYGIIISIYTLSASLAGFFISFFVDRYPRKKALLVGLSLFITGNALLVFSSHYYSLLILARVITGASGGFLTSMVVIYVGDLFHITKLGRTTAAVMIANGIATIVGVPAATFFSHLYHWKFPFVILLVINSIIFLCCLLFLPKIPQSPRSKINSEKFMRIIKNPTFIWPAIFMGLLSFTGGSTILPFLSTFVCTNFSFTAHDVALIFFSGGLSALFANLFVGTLIDRFGKQNVFLLLNFLSIIPLLLLTTFPFAESEKSIIIVVTTSFFCFSSAKSISGITLVNSLMPAEQRGRYITLTSAIQLLAGSAATALSGAMLYIEDGELINFDLLGIIGICATIVCIFAAFVLEE